jgi:hypothetical protein
MPPPPPPPPPFSLRLALKDLNLNVNVPVAVVLALILVGVPRAIDAVEAWAAPPATRAAPQDPDPGWAVDARGTAMAALASAMVNELPPASPMQRTPPNCDPDLERPLRGACWVPVDVSPCPKGKAYLNDKGPEADGKCYARGMKAARSPTSGDPRPPAIADP